MGYSTCSIHVDSANASQNGACVFDAMNCAYCNANPSISSGSISQMRRTPFSYASSLAREVVKNKTESFGSF